MFYQKTLVFTGSWYEVRTISQSLVILSERVLDRNILSPSRSFLFVCCLNGRFNSSNDQTAGRFPGSR